MGLEGILWALLSAVQGAPCVPPQVDSGTAKQLLASGDFIRWPGAKIRVETRGSGYVLAWVTWAKAMVLLRGRGEEGRPSLITFERISAADRIACTPAVEIPDWLGSRVFLHAFQADGSRATVEPIVGQAVVGVRSGSEVVLFPREGDHPRTISFDTEGRGRLHYLATGLSMGTWEVWWNGGLVDPDLPAAPGGTLQFDGPSGGYFLRRR